MATGWLKGTAKAVPSGDLLLIMGIVKGGPPPEKTITLARDGRRSMVGMRLFAWDSQEYVRKKCIGKLTPFNELFQLMDINGILVDT